MDDRKENQTMKCSSFTVKNRRCKRDVQKYGACTQHFTTNTKHTLNPSKGADMFLMTLLVISLHKGHHLFWDQGHVPLLESPSMCRLCTDVIPIPPGDVEPGPSKDFSMADLLISNRNQAGNSNGTVNAPAGVTITDAQSLLDAIPTETAVFGGVAHADTKFEVVFAEERPVNVVAMINHGLHLTQDAQWEVHGFSNDFDNAFGEFTTEGNYTLTDTTISSDKVVFDGTANASVAPSATTPSVTAAIGFQIEVCVSTYNSGVAYVEVDGGGPLLTYAINSTGSHIIREFYTDTSSNYNNWEINTLGIGSADLEIDFIRIKEVLAVTERVDMIQEYEVYGMRHWGEYDWEGHLDTEIYQSLSHITYTHWDDRPLIGKISVQIYDSGNPATNLKLGTIYAGNAWEPPFNIAKGSTFIHENRGKINDDLTAGRVLDTNLAQTKAWNLAFHSLTEAQMAQMQNMLLTVGTSYQSFLIIFDRDRDDLNNYGNVFYGIVKNRDIPLKKLNSVSGELAVYSVGFTLSSWA